MYKIENPKSPVLEKYFKRYGPILKKISTDFLDKGFIFKRKIGRKNVVEYTFGIDCNRKGLTYKFLVSLKDDSFLKAVLTGDMKTMLNLIDIVSRDSENNFTKLSKLKLKRHDPSNISDDFHTIMEYIFVEVMYERQLDKRTFVKDCNLKVCPYCGATSIYIHNKTDGKEIKPQIDHFLPKSKYPFLAMNYFNLIPSCERCNQIPNKGDYDPLMDNGDFYLPYPYSFDDELFEFGMSYNGRGEFNEDNFGVYINYKDNTHFQVGYNSIIAIEDRYRKDSAAVKKLWHQVKAWNNSRRYLLQKTLGTVISQEFNLSPQNILGYPIDDESSREQEKYKFSKDIVSKMIDLVYEDSI